MADDRRPNVLLISIHDLNTHLGCYGNGMVQSPHLDRLASQGRAFQNHLCNYPICGPSRASLLTGRRPDSTQVLNNMGWFRDALPDVVTLPAHFKANGYWTAKRGAVFHGGLDDESAWDIGGKFAGPRPGRTPEQQQEREAHSDRFEPVEDGGVRDEKISDWAVKMLEAHHLKQFFIAAGFNKPHTPLTVSKRYFDLYNPNDIELPPRDPDLEAQLPEPALRPNSDIFIRRTARDEDEVRRAKLAYYASISFVDEQVGKILDAVDRLGLWENTVVALFSDHGFHLGEHGMWSKMTLFESSTRVPFMVAAPGIEPPGIPTRRLSEHVDIYPTLCELCGLSLTEGLEGTSLAPLLQNPNQPWKQAVFSQIRRGNMLNGNPSYVTGRLVRTQQWHYIFWEGTGEEELYATEGDPYQIHDLSKQQEETVIQMRDIFRAGWEAARPST